MHNCYAISVMSQTSPVIYDYFAKLGFDKTVADIYTALYTNGPQTISQLSRNSGVERTLLYRTLPNLADSGLIETQTEQNRGVFKAAPFSNLQVLISKKEQQLDDLKTALPLIEQSLGSQLIESPGTRVQLYRGEDGVKQMLWNETKAKSEVLGVLYQNIQIKTNSKFFDRWVQKCNDSNIHFRGIVSDTFVASQQNWYANHASDSLTHWNARYIDPQVFTITHSTVVYDTVVAHFNWDDKEVFGVEVYNQQIADSQRQLFQLLWNQASENK